VETLEERLRHELERLSPPGDPAGVVDRVLRRAARRHARRSVGIIALTLSVIAGSVGGFYALTRVFGDREGDWIGPASPSNGRIAFVVDGPSDNPTVPIASTIYTVDPDGSDPTRLVAADGLVTDLDWSPDGRRLAYGRHDVFVLDLDDGETREVVVPGNGGYSPSWSPDGSRIALAVEQREGYAIYLMRPDGTDPALLTQASDLGWTDWSPDGTRILFVGPGPEGAYQGWDIYVMNADGSRVTNLTNSPTVDLDPNWSPDGATILFRSRRDPPPGWTNGDAPDELYLMAPNGSDVRRLTNDAAIDQSPVWSPDGTRIAFTSATEDQDPAIFTMRPDGTDRTRVPGISAAVIAWQPILESEHVSPFPSTAETPTESSVSDGIVDLGLGFPVCNVTSVTGDFVTPTDQGVAYVATKAPDTGGCPPGEEAPYQVLALDVNGDQRADVSYGPLECIASCSALAAPDINRDGIAEIAVGTGRADGESAMLFRVEASDGSLTIDPIEIAPPASPEHGFTPGPILFVVSGGGLSNSGGAYCLDQEDAAERLFVTWQAMLRDPETNAWDVTSGAFALDDGELVLDRVETYRVPEDEPELPRRIDSDLCGAPVV